jgi:hypothetical protein
LKDGVEGPIATAGDDEVDAVGMLLNGGGDARSRCDIGVHDVETKTLESVDRLDRLRVYASRVFVQQDEGTSPSFNRCTMIASH